MIELLEKRFLENPARHPNLSWEYVRTRLMESADSLEVLKRMEKTGGEPDVIGLDSETGKLIFCDCAKETPAGRRSLCYDEEALRKRAKNPPAGSALRQALRVLAQ